MAKFNPNRLTFDEGIERIRQASSKVRFSMDDEIFTSRDRAPEALKDILAVKNVPAGFTKWQLPIHFPSPTQTFLSFAAPRTKVPAHSHKEGAGIRVIISGSIKYKDTELGAGDWMYIPAGRDYEFEVGAMGVGMFYCYSCCCA